jgi:hypothetical protein
MLTRRDRIALKGAAPEVDTRLEKGVPQDGILIQWASLPDAQFAQAWHENVVHEEMADKYVRRAQKKFQELQEDEQPAEADGGQLEGSDGVSAALGRARQNQGLSREGKEPEETGWLGAMNPLRLFRGGGGEARS